MAPKRCFKKKITESFIFAPQERGLRTDSVKHSIDRTSGTPLCRLCGDATETV